MAGSVVDLLRFQGTNAFLETCDLGQFPATRTHELEAHETACYKFAKVVEMRPRPLSKLTCQVLSAMCAFRRKKLNICKLDQPFPRPEPHFKEVADACKKVYKEAHIEGGAMSVEVRLDVLTNPSELLVTFRGSESVRDWLINMFAMMVRYDDFMVHAGFLASWCSVDLQVVDAIDKYMQNLDAKLDGIVVAGHSLGSAMATLCALDLHRVRPQYKVRLTTFAGPRVGNYAMTKRLAALQPMTICHHGDFVPLLPVFSLLARSLYIPYGHVIYSPPSNCKNFIKKHRMDGYLGTVDAIQAAHEAKLNSAKSD